MNDPKPVPNYFPILRELAERGASSVGQVTILSVAHDDDCDVWQGKACNCEPTVTPRSPIRRGRPCDTEERKP